MEILIAVLIFIQLVAIVVHGYILMKYRHYCGHCDWWYDLGAMLFFAETFIPVLGIIFAIIGPIDYIRNIAETLTTPPIVLTDDAN